MPVEFSKGEWGPGQHEINVRYCDLLEMADRHVIYKQIAKEVAMQQGLAVTFMAKFDERYAGSSMHVHSSLWSPDGARPLFAAPARAAVAISRRLPEQFRWWLGGLMHHARACTLLFAPSVNSYKRFRAGSFAPTGIAWSYDNRTAGFRVVGRGPSLRVECRIPGADANPYLAFAATVAAGLDGLANQIEPPPMFRGDVYAAQDVPRVPATLAEAIAEFEASALFRTRLRCRRRRASGALRAHRATQVRRGRHLVGAAAVPRAGVAAVSGRGPVREFESDARRRT